MLYRLVRLANMDHAALFLITNWLSCDALASAQAAHILIHILKIWHLLGHLFLIITLKYLHVAL